MRTVKEAAQSFHRFSGKTVTNGIGGWDLRRKSAAKEPKRLLPRRSSITFGLSLRLEIALISRGWESVPDASIAEVPLGKAPDRVQKAAVAAVRARLLGDL